MKCQLNGCDKEAKKTYCCREHSIIAFKKRMAMAIEVEKVRKQTVKPSLFDRYKVEGHWNY